MIHKVYQPYIRARLGTAAHFFEVVVLKLRPAQVLVPAVRNVDDTDVLKKVSELPEWAQPAFEGTDALNRIQTKVLITLNGFCITGTSSSF